MTKATTRISGRRAFGWFTRLAQVQFLALIAMLSLLTLPALVRADDESGPSDLPGDKPAQPLVEPAQAIDESSPTEAASNRVDQLIQSIVEATKSRIKMMLPDAKTDEQAEARFVKEVIGAGKAVTPAPKDAATDVPDEILTDEDPAATEEKARVPEVTQKEAEIDTIAAEIELEKIRSARRIAELEQQLNEARDELTAITSTDSEGFIRSWLVLGPIAVDGKVSNHDEDSNKEFLDRQYVPSRATPRDGETATIDGTELTWKAIQSSDYFVDLAQVAADQQLSAEHAAYLGVAYITSEEEVTNVKLSIGSDDDSVWRLNGKEVIRSYTGRGVAKDQDSAEELTLKKGVNVLTFTVLNGEGPTAAAARFVDEDGNRIKGLKVSLTPPSGEITQTDVAPEAGNNEQPVK